jgi:hypothetical protein
MGCARAAQRWPNAPAVTSASPVPAIYASVRTDAVCAQAGQRGEAGARDGGS